MTAIFKAFTIQSNMAAAGAALAVLIFGLARKIPPSWLCALKFMATTAVLLTWFVFAVVLTPTMPAAYLLSLSNFLLHTLTPAMALADYLLFDRMTGEARKLKWLALPLPGLYAIYFFAETALRGEMPVPYFFLDYRALGFFTIGRGGIGVAYWCVILLLLCLGLGAGALRLKAAAEKKAAKTSLIAVGVMVWVSVVLGVMSVVF